MFKGFVFALSACLIWGLIFVVPQMMEGFTAIEVALGRYLFFGALSLCIFFRSFKKGSCRYSAAVWKNALTLSFASTICYYIAVVLSLRYATPAICALVLGVSPVTIAFYGNWKQKECRFRSLLFPSLLILLGLIIINAPHLILGSSKASHLLGLLSACIALVCWSWYVVANANFLKKFPEVKSSDWSTLIGVATFAWVILCSLMTALFFKEQLSIDRYLHPDFTLVKFLFGCSILGFLCSWVGSFLWNKASARLPVSLAGQLTIFETIFGVLFVYLLEQKLPPLQECIGIVFLLAAIMYAIRSYSKSASSTFSHA